MCISLLDVELYYNKNMKRKFLLTPWLLDSLRVLASLITDALSSPPTACCRRLLTFISCKSSRKSSSHLSLGHPVLLLPSDLVSNIFLTLLPWSILTTRTCPVPSSNIYSDKKFINHSFKLSPFHFIVRNSVAIFNTVGTNTDSKTETHISTESKSLFTF
jgi:hypothetical protein